MECNKEEASKAKDIAEQKLKDEDFASAQRFALKAQRLYPALDGIKQLLDTLEVYICANHRTNGEVDWYRVLGLECSADDDMIRKRYEKLALSLHPDKNKSVGAAGAFKIVSEACDFISNKNKRLEFNCRLKMRDMPTRTSDQTPSVSTGQNGNHNIFNNIHPQAACGASHAGPVPASVPTGQNGNHNFFNNIRPRASSGASHAGPVPASISPDFNYFWTKCSYCKQYIHLHRTCINQYSPCQNCYRPYFTIEVPPPPSYVQGYLSTQHQRTENPCATGPSPSVHMQGVNVTHSRPTESPNAARTKADQSSNNQGVSSKKHKSDTGALRDAYERGVVMGLASPNSGIGQRVRGTASSAAEAGRLKKMHGVAPATDKLKKHGVAPATDKEEPHKRSQVLNGTSTAAGSATASSRSGTCSASKEDKPSEKRCTHQQRKNNLVNGTGKRMENGVEKVAEFSKWVGRGNAKQTETEYGNVAKCSPQKVTARGAVNKTENGEKVAHSSSAKGGLHTRMSSAGVHRPDVLPVFSQAQINAVLKKRAEIMITNKLKEWGGLAALSKALDKDAKKKEGKQHPESVSANKGIDSSKSPVASTDKYPSVEGKIMSVSDPDFHNFDGDRVEKSFGKNQVWAAYDDDDGMPRLYVMVHEVVSFRPFRLQISWLNSKSNQEFSPLNWVNSGFPKTSGEYWIGKYATFKLLNSLSHKVNGWTKGKKGIIQIYPSKGDVWALYRNWSPDWNESTPHEVVHKYDMVEVLEDYDKDEGVTVAFLIKVAGFKTVFRRHPDQSKYWTIPREEMFRFSHQVPSHLLTGNEGHGAPVGCLELDPAAMPLVLLQVITKVQEEEMVALIEKASGERPNRPIKRSGEEHLSNNVVPLEEDAQEAVETRKRKGKEIEEQELPASKRRHRRN